MAIVMRIGTSIGLKNCVKSVSITTAALNVGPPQGDIFISPDPIARIAARLRSFIFIFL